MQCAFFHFFRLYLFPFRGCSLFGLLFWPLSTPEVHPQKKNIHCKQTLRWLNLNNLSLWLPRLGQDESYSSCSLATKERVYT